MNSHSCTYVRCGLQTLFARVHHQLQINKKKIFDWSKFGYVSRGKIACKSRCGCTEKQSICPRGEHKEIVSTFRPIYVMLYGQNLLFALHMERKFRSAVLWCG